MRPTQDWVALPEAAARLGLDAGNFRKLVAAGRVPGARKLGGIWLITWPCTITPGTRGPARKIRDPNTN